MSILKKWKFIPDFNIHDFHKKMEKERSIAEKLAVLSATSKELKKREYEEAIKKKALKLKPYYIQGMYDQAKLGKTYYVSDDMDFRDAIDLAVEFKDMEEFKGIDIQWKCYNCSYKAFIRFDWEKQRIRG